MTFTRRFAAVTAISLLSLSMACAKKEEPSSATALTGAAAGTSTSTAAAPIVEPETWVNPEMTKKGWKIAFSATPNPLCSAGNQGIVKLDWATTGPGIIEIRVGSPTGDLFTQQGAAGSHSTGPWVSDGMKFFLQDVTDDKPRTSENTLATVTVAVRKC